MGQTVGVQQGYCMEPVLFLFMVMDFSETLENDWVKAGLQMVTFRQHTHSPRDVGRLTGHKKKTFEQVTLLALFCVLYVDDGAFPFEDRDQLTRGLSFIYSHFTRFGLEMHVGRGKKDSKTECVFFPLPGFFERKCIMPADNGMSSKSLLVPRDKTKRESYESRHKREEAEYDSRFVFSFVTNKLLLLIPLSAGIMHLRSKNPGGGKKTFIVQTK